MNCNGRLILQNDPNLARCLDNNRRTRICKQAKGSCILADDFHGIVTHDAHWICEASGGSVPPTK
jgi:hypothetical protein